MAVGSILGRYKPKTLKLVYAASPKHLRVKAKTGWPRFRIVCLCKVTCHLADCCLRELARLNLAQSVGQVKSRFIHHHSLICLILNIYEIFAAGS